MKKIFKILKRTFVNKEELVIHYKNNFTRGKDVFIGGGEFFCQGGLIIDDNVIIANDLLVLTSDHVFDISDSYPFNNQIRLAPVHIKTGVWIGSRVTILPGVIIGEHSIVGANSVVTKSLEPYGVYVGNPARLIRTRDAAKLSALNSEDFVYNKYGHDKLIVD